MGEFYCARYSQDSKWYRARILSVDMCGMMHKILCFSCYIIFYTFGGVTVLLESVYN